MTEEVRQHILLHLQDIIRQIEVKDYRQISHDAYEIGQHLGFSVAEVNNDKEDHSKYPARQD